MSIKVLWVCGKHRGNDDAGNPAWDLQGVFETETAAVAACQGRHDFIGPVPLNQKLPQGATAWPNCRYPLAGEVPQASPPKSKRARIFGG